MNFLGGHEDAETFYCADFYRVPEKCSVEDYSKYVAQPDIKTLPSGAKLAVGKIEKSRLPHGSPYGTRIALIVNPNEPELRGLLANDVYRQNERFQEMKGIVNFNALDNDRFMGNNNRLSAVLVGVPSKFISGIMVDEKIQRDRQAMGHLENSFPNAYIVNTRGLFLRVPERAKTRALLSIKRTGKPFETGKKHLAKMKGQQHQAI